MALSALVLLGLPALAHAQYYGDEDNNWGPPPYNDVDNGQLLQLASYVLSPCGYLLEWSIFRPMHYVATQTSLTPMLSGDTDRRYFGEISNAALLPPNTFAPFKMPANPNAMEAETTPPAPANKVVAPYAGVKAKTVPEANGVVSGQPALH